MQETGCSAQSSEPFALRVMGDSMMPEFRDGHIILVDPGLSLRHGVYAVIEQGGEILFGEFRQDGQWQRLHYLNPVYKPVALLAGYTLKGIVTQRSTGRRKEIKHYAYPVM